VESRDGTDKVGKSSHRVHIDILGCVRGETRLASGDGTSVGERAYIKIGGYPLSFKGLFWSDTQSYRYP
jgi:hypothetical protein